MTALILPLTTTALTIVPTFDTTITSDPNAAAIEATINSAIAVYEADFSDPITVNFTFKEVTTGLASSLTRTVSVSYSAYLTALTAHAASIDDAVALAHLPGGANNPVNGNSQVTLKDPLARALGFSANPGGPDSTVSLNISIMNITSSNPNTNKYSLFSAVSHEMDEGLAFGGGLNGLTNGAPAPTGNVVQPMDLLRYDQNGNRSWTTAFSASAFCSLDGVTDLVQFNQNQGGDFEDWYSSPVFPRNQVYPAPEVQDAYATPDTFPVLGVELRVLDAIGLTYNSGYQAAPVWVNFNYSGTQNGTYQNPYETLSQGASAVASGGTVAINATVQASHSAQTLTISKAMTIISVNGPSTIGQ
ncbi:MAG TPA: NF038122 family metalloprotease [Verrucomicrobiae bacterium]|jgi:hypothetical protein|nr:NF038122 family metalloprotease [Verrucomicrobiae bacterium]